MARKSVKLSIPHPAISTNQLHMGKKVRSYEYRKFRKEVFSYLQDNCKLSGIELKGNLIFTLEVGVSNPASDLSNTMKGIEDVLAEFFSFNDKQTVSIKLDKYIVNKGDEYMLISLRSTTKNIDKRTKPNGKRTE